VRRWLAAAPCSWHRAASALALLVAGCSAFGGHRAAAYVPRSRDVTLTTVPVLVREHSSIFPFLKQDFASGGILEGREVYAFVPSTITAIAGDTLKLTVINPEDDLHTLILPGLSLSLPGQQTTRATYVCGRPGIYEFRCNLPNHSPMMWGQLVVLSPESFEER